jgi:hypothetical protein
VCVYVCMYVYVCVCVYVYIDRSVYMFVVQFGLGTTGINQNSIHGGIGSRPNFRDMLATAELKIICLPVYSDDFTHCSVWV